MKYPQRKIDALRTLANAPRPLSISEVFVNDCNKHVHKLLKQMITENCVKEINYRYVITKVGQTTLEVIEQTNLSKRVMHSWVNNICTKCGSVKLSDNKYIIKGKVSKYALDCL